MIVGSPIIKKYRTAPQARLPMLERSYDPTDLGCLPSSGGQDSINVISIVASRWVGSVWGPFFLPWVASHMMDSL